MTTRFLRQWPGALLGWATGVAVCFALAIGPCVVAGDPLPGTTPLLENDPLDVRMMRGAHRFVERKIDEATRNLAAQPALDHDQLSAKRSRLQFLVGAGGREREPHSHLVLPPYQTVVRMQRISDDVLPAIVFENERLRITRVQWPVYDGVTGEGLLLEPLAPPVAHVVVVPDADQSPEMLAGLVAGLPPENQLARRLADSGARVIVPLLINRDDVSAGKPWGISNREWIYRQAFHMGRHVLGYEVDKVIASVDWFADTDPHHRPIGIAGWGEGERIAKLAMLLDTRLDAALLSGQRTRIASAWREPIYRNVWSLTAEFDEPVFKQLIGSRTVVLEERPEPVIDATRDKAMPASLASPTSEPANEAANEAVNEAANAEPAFGDAATAKFAAALAVPLHASSLAEESQSESSLAEVTPDAGVPQQALAAFMAERHQRQLRQLDDYTQRLARESAAIREAFYLKRALPKLAERKWSTQASHETTPVSEFTAHTEHYRDLFWNEAIGKFDDPLLPANPRSRCIRETEDWVAYDVVLDVVPELFAWGILMLPKQIAEGERRPVVVVQHGRDGLPAKVLDGGYNGIAEKLLRRGYIVFAPHNLYRGEDEYRWLDRKANSIGKSLFSFLLLQHDQITRWLADLPQVDAERIAFYGNSYGGESAVRIPPVLTRYALSICASDFNDWTRKVTDTHDSHSFMRTIEWEMPYFNWGNTFSYAEMAYLMIPRPFMVERGHHDLVAPDHWVAAEYAKVRLVYDQLGIGDRTAITFFQGGHTMRGDETIEFIERHFR